MKYKIFVEVVRLVSYSLFENKFRSFLSLFGVSIGVMSIVCIFSVVNSLEKKINQSVESLGNNVLYIQKWPWNSAKNYQWWKFFRNPEVTLHEFKIIKEQSKLSEKTAFVFSNKVHLEYENTKMNNVEALGVTEQIFDIWDVKIHKGRFLSNNDIESSKNFVVIGYEIYKNFFGDSEAIGQMISVEKRDMIIIGILKKQGESIVGVSRDFSILVGNVISQKIFKITNPMILCEAKKRVEIELLKTEINSIMRKIRKLRPKISENFALNESSIISEGLEKLFITINLSGWIIGGFSLIVGGFGIANIMFVSVKERTKEIGIQKSLGSSNNFILLQYLIESIILCLAGGFFGILLCFLLIQLMSFIIPFAIYISLNNILVGVLVSTLVGVLSGFLPARVASRLNPVDAIRT